jgi:hypothetical protein
LPRSATTPVCVETAWALPSLFDDGHAHPDRVTDVGGDEGVRLAGRPGDPVAGGAGAVTTLAMYRSTKSEACRPQLPLDALRVWPCRAVPEMTGGAPFDGAVVATARATGDAVADVPTATSATAALASPTDRRTIFIDFAP